MVKKMLIFTFLTVAQFSTRAFCARKDQSCRKIEATNYCSMCKNQFGSVKK